MRAKALELRDAGTFLPVLAVDMNPSLDGEVWTENGKLQRQQYLLRRCGYACDGRPNILLTRLEGYGQATNDPHVWPKDTRTMPVAHRYIIEHWDELKDGDVVDVEFILGLSATIKPSERDG